MHVRLKCTGMIRQISRTCFLGFYSKSDVIKPIKMKRICVYSNAEHYLEIEIPVVPRMDGLRNKGFTFAPDCTLLSSI